MPKQAAFIVSQTRTDHQLVRVYSDGWMEIIGWTDVAADGKATTDFVRSFTGVPLCLLTYRNGYYDVSSGVLAYTATTTQININNGGDASGSVVWRAVLTTVLTAEESAKKQCIKYI